MENFVFGYFWLELEKKYCHFRNQYLEFFNVRIFHAKIKSFEYWSIFGLEFKKAMVIFEINAPEFV